MKKSPSILTFTIVLGVLCILLAASIFAVNSITEPIIATSEEQTKQDAFKEIIPEADDFVDVTSDAGDDPAILEVYEAKSGNETVGYLYLVSTTGYADVIENLVAIDTATDSIKSIKILKQTETPGLGAKSGEPAFQYQFQGLAISTITVVKNGASIDNNEIDAITASTITSNAVTKGVNIAIDDYLKNFSN